MANESVLGVLEKWESTGEITRQMVEVVEQQFDAFMAYELNEMKAFVDTRPYLVFARLARLTLFLNTVMKMRPSVVKRLERWVQRLRTLVNALCKNIGADGFSIGLGLPVGISIELSFPIT